MMPLGTAFILIILQRVCYGADWFVSSGGQSQPCGTTREVPCHDLMYVISQAADGDVINIDGRHEQLAEGEQDQFYPWCSENSDNTAEVIHKSLEIVGENGRPRMGCSSHAINDTITAINHNATSECRVIFRNVDIENGVLSVRDCIIEVINSTFVNASLTSQTACDFLTLVIIQTSWYGLTECNNRSDCKYTPPCDITCNITDIKIAKSHFYQTHFIITSFKETKMLVSDVLFSNRMSDADLMGGLKMSFNAANADIYIRDSIFEKQLHPTRLKSVINLFESSLWLKAVGKRINNEELPDSNATVVIENVQFEDNERGLTLVGPYKRLDIKNCFFTRNVAMHAGAALLVLTNEKSEYHVLINNCTFVNNSAGRYRKNYRLMDPEGTFNIAGNEVSVKSECCNGVIDLVGKGGAIRVQKGNVMIVNSYFINNTARMLGGSVFVDIDGRLNIKNAYFENTPIHEHSLQGDILYSDGHKVVISEVKLNVKSAQKSLSILRHSGDHWSMDISNVWIQCPVGFNLRTTNSSAYGVAPEGLRRSHELDQLSYFCESCPRNKYSLDYGYLNYTLVFKQWAYLSLLINGKEPQPAYTGRYDHHEAECDDCPYGGQCVSGITAVANFWGFKYQNKSIRFQHCPKGYCCSTRRCSEYNTCARQRHGRLCGRCKPGYSEALFSTDCIPNSHCGPIWLWPFVFSVGLVYSLFLLFQTDLKHFLFSGPCECCGITYNIRASIRRSYFNSKVRLKVNLQETVESKFIENVKEHDEVYRETPNGVLHANDNDEDEKVDTPNVANPTTGFLIILFYYFQDALLLHVDTVYVKLESKTQKLLKSILAGLFKFQLDLFELIEEVCAVPDMTPIPKTITKALIVPYVIIIFLLMYLLHKWWKMMGASKFEKKSNGDNETNSEGIRKSFSTRLAAGFILALLFTFQKLGTTTFMLLNCVPVEQEHVLLLDGTVTCFQYWQYGVLAYALSCMSPFCIVLMVGPSLMRRKILTLSQFFLACLCPLPAIIWWLLERLSRRHRNDNMRRPLSHETKVVIEILQGPFKETTHNICWAGVLIGRRLILILLYTFVNDGLIRLLCMLLTCFVILLHHVHVQPYKDTRGNIAGTASASALVTLGCINLVRAGFEAAEYTPTGPNAFLMKAFDQIENALMIWFPLSVMSFVFIVLIIRIILLIFAKACNCSDKTSVSVTAHSDTVASAVSAGLSDQEDNAQL